MAETMPWEDFASPQTNAQPAGPWDDFAPGQRTVLDEGNAEFVTGPRASSIDEILYMSGVQNRKEAPGRFWGMQAISGLGSFVAGTPGAIAGSEAQRTGEGYEETYNNDLGLLDAVNVANPFANVGSQQASYDKMLEALGVDRTANREGFSRLTESGKRVIEKKDRFLEKYNLTKQEGDGIAFDIGSGLGSVSSSIAMTFLTKNPSSAAIFFGNLQRSQGYLDAREAGKTAGEARAISNVMGLAEAGLEAVGGSIFLKAAGVNGGIKKLVVRSVNEALQEGSQTAAEELITQTTGVTDVDLEGALKRIAYSAALGFIIGAPVNAVVGLAEKSATKAGLDQERAVRFAENLAGNQTEFEAHAAQMMENEASDMVNDPAAEAETAKIIEKFQNGEDINADTRQVSSGQEDRVDVAGEGAVDERNIFKLTLEQLEEGEARDKMSDDELLVSVLGEERAKEFKNIDRRQNSSQPHIQDKAFAEMDEFLKGVTREQEDAIYGVGETGATAEDYKDLIRAHSASTFDLENDPIDFIASSTANAMMGVDPVKVMNVFRDGGSIKEQAAAIRITKGIRALKDKGIGKDQIGPTLVAGLVKTGAAKESDAAEIVGVFMEAVESNDPRKGLPAKEAETAQQAPENKLTVPQKGAPVADNPELASLTAATVPLSNSTKTEAPFGETLSFVDEAKNKMRAATDKIMRFNVAKNQMDVIFDMLDGGKNYLGQNYKTFKVTVDRAWGRFNDLHDATIDPVVQAAKDLDLNESNFNKVGAWAVAQQEGGNQKLLDTGLTQAEIDNVKLDEAEMKFYNIMRKQLDSMTPEVARVFNTLTGEDLALVENYFSFLTDATKQDEVVEVQKLFQLPEAEGGAEVKAKSTIERTGGKQAVKINAMEVFLLHAENASYYVAMAEDLKRLGDLATSQEYAEASGDFGQELVVEWLNLMARRGAATDRVMWIDHLRKNTGLAILGYKVSTVVVQPTALAHASAMIGGDYVFRGSKDLASSREWRQFLIDNVPEIRKRAGGDPSFLDFGGTGIVSKVQDAGFWAMKNVDKLAASSVAIGAYQKYMNNNGLEIDLTQPNQEAVDYAQLVVRRTQSSGNIKDSAPLISQGRLTGNTSIDKTILQFQSFMLNAWSLVQYDLPQSFKQGRTAEGINMGVWLVLAVMAETGIRRMTKEAMAAALGFEPDEEEFTDDLIKQAISNVPIISQGASLLNYGSIPIPAVSMAVSAAQSLTYAGRSKSPDKKVKHYGNAALVASGLLGVPGVLQAKQIKSGLEKSNKDPGKKPGKKKTNKQRLQELRNN